MHRKSKNDGNTNEIGTYIQNTAVACSRRRAALQGYCRRCTRHPSPGDFVLTNAMRARKSYSVRHFRQRRVKVLKAPVCMKKITNTTDSESASYSVVEEGEGGGMDW